MKKHSGFTLIELLVVIAVIGILASVVLASLNGARKKGTVASVKQNLNNARAQAALYYDGNTGTANDSDGDPLTTGYKNVCGPGLNIKGIQSFRAAADLSGNATVCVDNPAQWAVEIRISVNPDTFWCVDSTGVARDTNANGVKYTHGNGLPFDGLAALTDTNHAGCN